MKLRYSTSSPYVRKVMITAHERGLVDRIELLPSKVAPTAVNTDIAVENPLVKVPTLVLDGGASLFDSRVICEYLDTLHDDEPLFPVAGAARWNALRRQATADGLLDAAILVRYESTLRPSDKRWEEWIAGQTTKIEQVLDSLEAEAEHFSPVLTIGEITIGCALDYLDVRYPEMAWRTGRPKLAAFFETLLARPSMQATRPE
jgi:glutathione S-transferase